MILNDRIIRLIELYFIRITCFTFLTGFLVFQVISEFYDLSWFNHFMIDIGKALTKNEGTLINIASIFIGIYFTVYTLLGSIKIESTFASIRKENFIKLVKFIKFSAVGAFIFLFYSIFNSILESTLINISPYLQIVSIALLIYMLLSALRLGIVVYLIYEKDLKNIHELIERDKREKNEYQRILFKLNKYLQSFEEEQRVKKAQSMKEYIRDRREQEENPD